MTWILNIEYTDNTFERSPQKSLKSGLRTAGRRATRYNDHIVAMILFDDEYDEDIIPKDVREEFAFLARRFDDKMSDPNA